MRGVQKDGQRRSRAFPIGLPRLVPGPRSARGPRDTRNATDSIYRNGGSRSLLKVTKTASGYRAGITMGVHRG
jgi:hypothetical protein